MAKDCVLIGMMWLSKKIATHCIMCDSFVVWSKYGYVLLSLDIPTVKIVICPDQMVL